jgi:UDP-glucose 4-epimerase
MKILVTGGAGFIGSNLSDKLLELGHEVHILDNMFSGKQENIPANAVFHKLDIIEPATAELLKNERFEVIFHHAAQMDVRKSVEDPGFDARVNIVGTLNLLETAVHAGLKKFIFASSGGTVYGEQDYFPADENHPKQPLSPYGITKLTAEYYLYYYHKQFGLPYVALRYANVFGPRQNPHGEAGVVAIFCNKFLGKQQPVINGEGKQTRDYIFISDVVNANIAALNPNIIGSYNVGTGIETDVNTIYTSLNTLLGTGEPAVHGPAKPGEQLRSVLSVSKLNKETGWSPEITFLEGIEITANWFRDKHTK